MKRVVILLIGFILSAWIWGFSSRAEVPTPPRLSDNSVSTSKSVSLLDKNTIELRKDGDIFKDKATGDKYKVTEAGSTMTIQNRQTGEKVKFKVSGDNLTNTATGQEFKIKKDGDNIKLTKK